MGKKQAKGIQKYPWILLPIPKSILIVNISQGTNSVMSLLLFMATISEYSLSWTNHRHILNNILKKSFMGFFPVCLLYSMFQI